MFDLSELQDEKKTARTEFYDHRTIEMTGAKLSGFYAEDGNHLKCFGVRK